MSIKIQAVLVIYRMQLQESASYSAWTRTQELSPAFHAMTDLLVCDNTPSTLQTPPIGFQGSYLRQPDNPGLAKSYNEALKRAAEMGATWLLLLDQDTELTREYFDELQALSTQFAENEEIVAVVPKLMEGGVVQSPHPGISAKKWIPIPSDSAGLLENRGQHIFNSGALLRVSSLQAIGGFPEEFWLDCLDHATFHKLRSQAGRIFLMNASIRHTLSSNAAAKPDDVAYMARLRNMHEAELLFYRLYGTQEERKWHRRRLLRSALYAALKKRQFGIAWQNLSTAFRTWTLG